MLPSTPSKTAAVVIASRETAHTLLATLDALQRAIQAPTLIDVVVNGNPALASQLLTLLRSRQLLQRSTSSALRLWTLALGDKAHSMNEYLHRIWPGHAPAYFVDGYVRVRADAPALLAQALAADPGALAAAGVPGSGRTAAAMRAQMRDEGGLHGNFFLLGVPALKALRAMDFRLPVGLYRTDATPDPIFSSVIELDLSTVKPSLAGPARPQDRVLLEDMQRVYNEALIAPKDKRGYALTPAQLEAKGSVKDQHGWNGEIGNGNVVIASITSCTNTSNPSVMLGAGILAKKAVERSSTRLLKATWSRRPC